LVSIRWLRAWIEHGMFCDEWSTASSAKEGTGRLVFAEYCKYGARLLGMVSRTKSLTRHLVSDCGCATTIGALDSISVSLG